MKKARLTIELPVAFLQCVERLKARTGAASAVEVIRRALDVYYAVVSAEEAHLVVRGKDGKEETLTILAALV